MSKKLSEMSLNELWQLFPVFLVEHKECWKKWYSEEKVILQNSLLSVERISHIGSTAIPSIYAKPIIDILVEIPKDNVFLDYKNKIIKIGYICMAESKEEVFLNKGYTENGFAERVFHLHLKQSGNNNELYFRDYLIEYSEVARKYEKLKLKLCKEYKYNRNAYTSAKTEFVKKYTSLAKRVYEDKY